MAPPGAQRGSGLRRSPASHADDAAGRPEGGGALASAVDSDAEAPVAVSVQIIADVIVPGNVSPCANESTSTYISLSFMIGSQPSSC